VAKKEKRGRAITRKLENIAAVSAEFHYDKELFQQFYDNHGEHLSGFPGIWCYCVELGVAFTKAEKKFRRAFVTSDESYWIDAITNYVKEILESGDCPSMAKAKCIAFSNIARSSFPPKNPKKGKS